MVFSGNPEHSASSKDWLRKSSISQKLAMFKAESRMLRKSTTYNHCTIHSDTRQKVPLSGFGTSSWRAFSLAHRIWKTENTIMLTRTPMLKKLTACFSRGGRSTVQNSRSEKKGCLGSSSQLAIL